MGWGAPQTLAANNGSVSALKLARAGDRVVLAYLEERSSALAATPAVMAAAFDGSAWTTPSEQRAPALVDEFTLSGAGGATRAAVLGVVGADGKLATWTWDGNAWTPQSDLVDASAVDSAFDEDGTPWLAAAQGGDVVVYARQSPWSERARIAGVTANEVAVLPMREGSDRVLLVAWIEPGAGSTLGYAFVGADGTVLDGPAGAVVDDPARLAGLYLVPVRDARLTARAVVRADDGVSLDVREHAITFGAAPPDGGTGLDGGTGADAGDEVDGGAGADGGSDGGMFPFIPGCGCGGATGAEAAVLAMFAVLAHAARRRKVSPAS